VAAKRPGTHGSEIKPGTHGSETRRDPMTCLFCRIVAGEIPANVVYQDDDVLAFRDISPVAPIHVLVIPKQHLDGLGVAGPEHAAMLGKVMLAARHVAELEGIASSGFRTVINHGPDANQTVPHLHDHVLGKRTRKWPPG
jgi:histidine triad (HIT) family protein